MVSILCVENKSNYFKVARDLDLWTKERDAYKFKGTSPVIVHPPCPQWSRMKGFAKMNERERYLAYFCIEQVWKNGGIFEHPAGSSFFEEVGIKPTISIDQHWFGFPARKRTYLYFHRCRPLAVPLCFDAVKTTVDMMPSTMRSRQPLAFCEWLINCVEQTHK